MRAKVKILAAGLTVVVALCVGSGFPAAEAGQAMKLATILPADHPNNLGAMKFADLVKQKTQGAVTVDVYPASQLGSERNITEAVAMGGLDFALAGVSEYATRYKPVVIFDGPFVFRSREHMVKTWTSPIGQEIFDGMVKQIGIRLVSPSYYGTRHVTTGKVAARTPADLKGLKLRCPDQPMFVAVMKAIGATPTPMALSEVYLALQMGVVDGQENPAATIATMKFNEVQKYLIRTGHITNGVYIWTNDKKFQTLPAAVQQAIRDAGKEAADWTTARTYEMEDKYTADLKAKGMTIIDPDHDAFQKAAEPLQQVYEGIWGRGLLAKVRAIQ